jgi:hypothetical protein
MQRAAERLPQPRGAGRGAHPRRDRDEQDRARRALERRLQPGAAQQPTGEDRERDQAGEQQPQPHGVVVGAAQQPRRDQPCGHAQQQRPRRAGQQQRARHERGEHDRAGVEAAGRAVRGSGGGRRGRGVRAVGPVAERAPVGRDLHGTEERAPQDLPGGGDGKRGGRPLRDDAEPPGQRLVGPGELVEAAQDHVDRDRQEDRVVDQPQRQAGEELERGVDAARLQPAHHRRGDRLRQRRVHARRSHHGDGLEHGGQRGAVAGPGAVEERRARGGDPPADGEEELERRRRAAREERDRGDVGEAGRRLALHPGIVACREENVRAARIEGRWFSHPTRGVSP